MTKNQIEDRKTIRKSGVKYKAVHNGYVAGHDGAANSYIVYYEFLNKPEAIFFLMEEDSWSYDLERKSVVFSLKNPLNDTSPSAIKRKFNSLDKKKNPIINNKLYEDMHDEIHSLKIKTNLNIGQYFATIDDLIIINHS